MEKHQWGWRPGGEPGTLSKARWSQEGSEVKGGVRPDVQRGRSWGVLGGRREWQQGEMVASSQEKECRVVKPGSRG